jgi:hypothetical protein
MNKMPAKKPMGELPKRNSNLAKFIAGNSKVNKLNPAQSRVAAGKYREIVKATGAKTMDQTGVALGKAIKITQKKAAPAKSNSLKQLKKMSEMPKRPAKKLLPKKMGR